MRNHRAPYARFTCAPRIVRAARPGNLPPDCLNWQTAPSIGVNPMLVAMLREQALELARKQRSRRHAASSAQ